MKLLRTPHSERNTPRLPNKSNEVDPENVNVRIISARGATTAEQSAYKDSL